MRSLKCLYRKYSEKESNILAAMFLTQLYALKNIMRFLCISAKLLNKPFLVEEMKIFEKITYSFFLFYCHSELISWWIPTTTTTTTTKKKKKKKKKREADLTLRYKKIRKVDPKVSIQTNLKTRTLDVIHILF